MLLIMIPDQYPNYYSKVSKVAFIILSPSAIEASHTGYFDSLGIMILFSYASSIVITREYHTCVNVINMSYLIWF